MFYMYNNRHKNEWEIYKRNIAEKRRGSSRKEGRVLVGKGEACIRKEDQAGIIGFEKDEWGMIIALRRQ